MKGQQRSEQLVKNEEDEYLKYSQNSSQQHSDRFQKTHINFQGIQKAAFYQLIQKTQNFAKSILIRLTNYAEKQNHKLYLKQYLTIIEEIFHVDSYTFNRALNDFKHFFQAQLRCIWQKFSQQKRIQYEQFGKENYIMMRQLEREQKVNEQKFSGFQMLKIDVLCIAFLFNNHYFVGLKNTRKLLTYDLLSKIFGLNKNCIVKMACMFNRSQKDIRLDYRIQFHQYFEFLYFISLSYKLMNYSKRNGKEAFDNISLVDIKLNDDFKNQAQNSNHAKFRFCQIAYESILLMLKQRRISNNAYVQTKKRRNATKLSKMSNQLGIPLNFLQKMSKEASNAHKEQYLIKFQRNLFKCQWVFLKGPYSLLEGINTAFQSKIANSAVYWAKNRQRLMFILLKLAMERFNLLPNIFKMQQKLDQNLFIYVHKFQYSLREIEENKKTEFGDIIQQKFELQLQDQLLDLKCSLVMLVANQQILAYSTCRDTLNQDYYMSVIKLCLKQKVIQYTKSFTLVLYGFNIQKPIDWQTFTQFQIYMNKNYDSRIYMINDPDLFQPHFLIDAFIKCFLSQLSLTNKNFQVYFQVCINKLLKEIDFFNKKTSEQYFEYFQKVMSLEFGIRDIWKCFKKERGNKYNALIFGGSDIEEGCPEDFRFLMTEEIPSQQWFFSIRYCKPTLQNFIKYQELENWKKIQSFQDLQPKDFVDFLKKKHMREKQVKRILRDVARCLIDYQLIFKELIDNQQEIKKSTEKIQIVSFLMVFYQSQNNNIEQVYSRPQREALFCQFVKKYDKQIKANYFLKKSTKNEPVVKTQSIQ